MMKSNIRRILLKKENLLFALAIILFIVTSWVAWNYYDISVFLEWTRIAENKNILKIYSDSKKAGYMPLAPIVFIATYMISKAILSAIVNIINIASSSFYIDFMKLSMRIPLLVSIVLTGLILYKKEGWNVAKWWIFGIPVWIVYLAYQFDPLMVLFMVIGAYFIVEKKYKATGFFWGLGAALKFVPILLLPLAFKVIGNNRKNIIKFLSFFTIPVVFISLPFLLFNPVIMVKKVLEFHASRYPQMLSIFNIPMLLTNYGFSYANILSWIWIPIFLSLYFLILWHIRVREGDKDSIFLAIGVLVLTFIIFNKVQNPQYILWAYPFLTYSLGRMNSGGLKKALLLATVLGSLIYPLIYYLPPAVLNKPILIEEDMQLYNARDLLMRSFDGSAIIIVKAILQFFETCMKNMMIFLYNNFNILGAIVIGFYNSLLLTIWFTLSLRNKMLISKSYLNLKKLLVKLIRGF